MRKIAIICGTTFNRRWFFVFSPSVGMLRMHRMKFDYFLLANGIRPIQNEFTRAAMRTLSYSAGRLVRPTASARRRDSEKAESISVLMRCKSLSCRNYHSNSFGIFDLNFYGRIWGAKNEEPQHALTLQQHNLPLNSCVINVESVCDAAPHADFTLRSTKI